MEQLYARILKSSAGSSLPVGSILPIESYHRLDYIADAPLLGVTVVGQDGERGDFKVGTFAFAGAGEAKSWRAEQKRKRSKLKRGL